MAAPNGHVSQETADALPSALQTHLDCLTIHTASLNELKALSPASSVLEEALEHLVRQSAQLEIQVQEMAAWLAAGRELNLSSEKKKKLWKQGFQAGKGKEMMQIIGRKRKAEEDIPSSPVQEGLQNLQLMAPASGLQRERSPTKRARRQEEIDAIVEKEDISAEVEARLKARRRRERGRDDEGKRRRSSGISERGGDSGSKRRKRSKRRSSGISASGNA